jgi:hypothetical protein
MVGGGGGKLIFAPPNKSPSSGPGYVAVRITFISVCIRSTEVGSFPKNSVNQKYIFLLLFGIMRLCLDYESWYSVCGKGKI